jgi:hypothetical protein
MQTTFSRPTQNAHFPPLLAVVHRADKPESALGIVDGLLSVTQQQWALGLPVIQSGPNPKAAQ